MSNVKQSPRPRKVCFVTIGATAAFDSLIHATLRPPFRKALQSYGYTDLRLQYGKDGATRLEPFKDAKGFDLGADYGLTITGFDFNKQGLGSEMRAAKEGECGTEGVVISHAGTCHPSTLME